MDELGKNSLLYDKILGCLAGGALGDSIGGVSEMMSYQKVEAVFGWIDRPLPTGSTPETARFSPGLPAGRYTDDTLLKNLLCEAIIRKGGRVTADDLAEVWLEKMQGWYYTPVLNAFHKIFQGDARPRDAGRGCMASHSSAMSISPVGIINAGNPAQAAQDAYDVASIIHEGDGRDGAVAVAAAVAEAFNPQATVESIVQAAQMYLYPKGVMRQRIGQALELARKEGEYKAFRQSFYETMLIPTPQGVGVSKAPSGFYDTAEPREGIPAALALFWLAGGKWRQSVEYCANFGRDADTLATMAGAIAGAFEGARAIPKDWLDMLPAANPDTPDLNEQAAQIGSALLKNIDAIQKYLDTLKSLSHTD